MRYNIKISYKTTELNFGKISNEFLPFTWKELPKYKNSNPLETQIDVGDIIIYSNPNNEKDLNNGMLAIVTKINKPISLAQSRNNLQPSFFKNKLKNNKTILYDINFKLDSEEKEELDFLNIEGKTKTFEMQKSEIERSFLLAYSKKSLLLEIDDKFNSSKEYKKILRGHLNKHIKDFFINKKFIPKYVDKNKENYENWEEWKNDNFFRTNNTIEVGNIIKNNNDKMKNKKFKRNKTEFLIKDLKILDFDYDKKKIDNYSQKNIDKYFYNGKKLKRKKIINMARLNLSNEFSIINRDNFFKQIIKKKDVFNLYNNLRNPKSDSFKRNVLMGQISRTNEFYNFINRKIESGFLKQPIIRQLFIIEKILNNNLYNEYINSSQYKTIKPTKKKVEEAITDIFNKNINNKPILNINVNVKFYIKSAGSLGSALGIGTFCDKKKDIIKRDFIKLIGNTVNAWTNGKIGAGKSRRKRRKPRKTRKHVKRRKPRKTRNRIKRRKHVKTKKHKN
jgi:hypothetical protein